MITVYVDDLMLLDKTSTVIQQFKAAIGKQFSIKDLRPAQDYLGIEISRDRTLRTITLSQEAYLEAVLKKFGMETCSPRSSPFSDGVKLKLNDKNFADQATKQEYQSGIRSLTYGMQGTRPDIAYSVSLLSCFLSKPTNEHYHLFKGILRYLRGSIKQGIVYSRGSQQRRVTFTDADHAGKTLAGDEKSTSGYVIFLSRRTNLLVIKTTVIRDYLVN